MPDSLDCLRRADQTTGASPYSLPLFTNRVAAACRTGMGKLIRNRVSEPLLRHNIEDLWNHIARALDEHRVAHPDIPAFAERLAIIADAANVVLIVQCGIGDNHATDCDRLKPCNRGQRAGATDLN